MKKGKRLLALFLTLVLALSTVSLTGCGSSSASEGKTFVYALGSSWDTLFPYGGSAEDYGRSTWEYMYGTFALIDNSDEILDYMVIPSESKAAADGKSITFKVNTAMKWSDGEAYTANDWLYTFKTMTDPSVVCTMKNYFNIFKGVDANGNLESGASISDAITVDGDTLTVYLDDVTNVDSFLYTYNNFFFVMPEHKLKDIAPAEIPNSDYWNNPITTGPFVLESEIAGSQLTFKRNTYFPLWDDYSNIEKFVIKVVGTDVMIEGIASGEISYVMSTLSANDCAEAVELDGVSGEPMEEATMIVFMAINNQTISDSRVRRALDLALNRDYMCSQIMGGHAFAVNTFERSKYLNKDIKAEYNLKKAKELLDAAAADGKFDYSKPIQAGIVSGFREQIASVLKNDLASIGVTLNITTGDATTINGKMQDSGAYDICLVGGGMTADPTWPMNALLNPAVSNYSQITDSKYYDMCLKINSEQDETKRAELVNEFQKVMYEDAPYVFVFTMESWKLYSSSLEFESGSSSGTFTGTMPRFWTCKIKN